jgi:hypothetical protein
VSSSGPRSSPLGAGSRRAVPLVTLFLIFSLTLLAGAVVADAPVDRVALTAEQASATGVAVRLIAHPEAGRPLIQAVLGPADIADAGGGGQLLALSPAGDLAALGVGALVIARLDGSQLRLTLPGGVLAAAFSADASRLVAIDGRGSLWSIATVDGSAVHVADGPFLGPLTVRADGSTVLNAVASVDAPFVSRAVSVDPQGRSSAPLTDDRLVYAAIALADGSFAVVAHQPDGTVVRRVTPSGTSVMAVPGRGAVNVAVAADGSHVAFDQDGQGVYLQDVASGETSHIADGLSARFAPDGRALLVRRDGGVAVLDLAGAVMASIGSTTVAFPPCAGGCAS